MERLFVGSLLIGAAFGVALYLLFSWKLLIGLSMLLVLVVGLRLCYMSTDADSRPSAELHGQSLKEVYLDGAALAAGLFVGLSISALVF